ncbi:nucleotidyl transferase AbiEii/AbiGii toxin family protein [Desulfobotulus mexicanus]|nr:nucleotidyl transferase AbiEii/AbiGii toxin family protein [Desulfobotulus mexicanus]
MERFLYRLSVSPHSDRFVLKGASLFLVWKGQNYRVTRDVDFLGFGSSNIRQLADEFSEICRIEFQDDGMIYLPESLNAEGIRDNQEYDGVRISLVGLLNQARIPLQIDIGFGDAVTPAPEKIEYPTIFDSPPPVLKAYPRYTLVAEKVEAMVRLGMANSRMKDFYDIWLVSKLFFLMGVFCYKPLRISSSGDVQLFRYQHRLPLFLHFMKIHRRKYSGKPLSKDQSPIFLLVNCLSLSLI